MDKIKTSHHSSAQSGANRMEISARYNRWRFWTWERVWFVFILEAGVIGYATAAIIAVFSN